MNNQRGITLIELLAVLTIISIISLLIVNFITSSQQTYISQQADSFQLAETTIFFNLVLSDIKKNPDKVKIDSNLVSINESTADSITYSYDNNNKVVNRNGAVVLKGVKSFQAKLENGNSIILIITNLDDRKYETIYFLRKGD